MIEDVEDDVDELSGSHFAKASARIFDKIDHGKDGVLPSSNFSDLVETLRGGVHSEGLTGHLHKVDPNESDSLDRFAFVRWHVEEEVSLYSVDEAEHLMGWGFKVSLMDLQYSIFWRVCSLKK